MEWCKKRGVVFYAVNRDFDEDTPERNSSYSRKLKVQMFIDDRNVGGLPDWGAIYQIISKRITYDEYLAQQNDEPKKKRRLWPF